LALSACERATPNTANGVAASGSDADVAMTAPSAALPPPPTDPAENALWAQALAADADDDDFARLGVREGADGLEAHLSDAKTRNAAIRALAYVAEEERFDALPLLASIATGAMDGATDDDGARAAATIEALAARPHRAVDREDASELRAGCDTLSAYVTTSGGKAEAKRLTSIARSLTMLRDYGCGVKTP
jgi:hypothetical protein